MYNDNDIYNISLYEQIEIERRVEYLEEILLYGAQEEKTFEVFDELLSYQIVDGYCDLSFIYVKDREGNIQKITYEDLCVPSYVDELNAEYFEECVY